MQTMEGANLRHEQMINFKARSTGSSEITVLYISISFFGIFVFPSPIPRVKWVLGSCYFIFPSSSLFWISFHAYRMVN